ncbi:MAG: hypothetical protein A2Z29_01100 [Chloroflexi bacterium RBG_16_56_11]|nr:MAG: hypothetical protein A2Z29_01100 [Chloroflexi bacterium RBG_16_56_11]
MSKVKKNALLFFIVVMSLLLLFIAGCGPQETAQPAATTTNEPPQELTQQELEQIVAESVKATMNANTYKVDMSMSGKFTADSTQSGDMSMTAKATFDVLQKKMLMSMEMSIDSGTSGGKQEVNGDIYLFTDYMYIKANMPDSGEQWIKVPVTDEILETFSANIMQEELKALELPDKLKFLRYEDFDGSECYVIGFTPNKDYLREYASRQQASDVEIDWDKLAEISDIYKELEYTAWIARDTKFVKKIAFNAVLELSSDFARSSNVDFETFTMDAAGNLELFEYNMPVSIVLPEEAAGAMELSPDAFTQ